jgi:hypothetical protein
MLPDWSAKRALLFTHDVRLPQSVAEHHGFICEVWIKYSESLRTLYASELAECFRGLSEINTLRHTFVTVVKGLDLNWKKLYYCFMEVNRKWRIKCSGVTVKIIYTSTTHSLPLSDTGQRPRSEFHKSYQYDLGNSTLVRFRKLAAFSFWHKSNL